jgi:hypothetical protein
MRGLEAVSCSAASVDVRLNASALTDAGTTLEAGTEKVYTNLLRAGWQVNAPMMMSATVLRTFPSTWAKRLAFGRDPRAMTINGTLPK